jgi:hypothetical protein
MTISTFFNVSVQNAASNARQDAYTNPNALSSIIFDGYVTNIDSATRASHFITLELFTGSVYRTIFKELEVPYGLTSPIPKLVVPSTYVVRLTCTDSASASVLELGLQVLERT